jgi:hypothetical protein
MGKALLSGRIETLAGWLSRFNQFYSYSVGSSFLFLRTYCDQGGSGDAGKLIQEDGEVQDASSRDQLKDKDETLSLFWNSFSGKVS